MQKFEIAKNLVLAKNRAKFGKMNKKTRFEIVNPTKFCHFGSLTLIPIFAKFEIVNCVGEHLVTTRSVC